MKRLLPAAAALLCAAGLSALAPAQTTTVTATALKMRGVPIAAGTGTIKPVNQIGQNVPMAGADGSQTGGDDGDSFPFTITGGAIANGFTVPDQALSTALVPNTPLWYKVTVTNSATKDSYTVMLPPGTVAGSTFAFDQYKPAQSAMVSSASLITGVSAPANCSPAVPSIFYNATQLKGCVGGVFVSFPGGNGGGSATTDASQLTSGLLPIARLANIPNTALLNSSITINGTAVPLGGSAAISTSIAVTAVPCNGATTVTLPNADAMFRVTPSAACTLSFTAPSGSGGYRYSFQVVGTAYTVTFPASSGSLTWTGGTPPTSPSSGQYADFNVKWFGSAPLSGTY